MLKKDTHLLLDLVRYFSCISVFIGHFFFIFIVRNYGLQRTYYHPNVFIDAAYFFSHDIAVMMFFVLSGFLITHKTLAEIHETQHFNLKNYLKKRSLRILPALYFSLFLVLMIYTFITFFHLFGADTYVLSGDHYSIMKKANLNLAMLLKCVFLLPGDTNFIMDMPLWSLSYEFYYYLLFAFILSLFINKNIKQALYLSPYVIALPLIASCLDPLYFAKFRPVLVLFLIWLAGAFIAYRHFYQQSFLSQKLNLSMSSLILIFIYPFATQMGDCTGEFIGGVVAIFFMMYIVNFKFKRTPPSFLFTLAKGSHYTYTLYLIHFPLLLLSFSFLGARVLHFHWVEYGELLLFLFILTTILSYYASLLLENRTLLETLFKKLSQKNTRRRPFTPQ